MFMRALTTTMLAGMLALTVSPSAHALSKTFTYDELAAEAAKALDGLKIQITNVGPFLPGTGTHFRSQASTVRLGGKRLTSFTVEPYDIGKVGPRSYRYYVSGLVSEPVHVEARDRAFLLTLPFAATHAPIVPRCVAAQKGGSAAECNSNPLPEIGLSGAALVARLEPIAHNGSIALAMTSVEVRGQPEISACTGLIGAFACNRIARLPAFTQKLRRKLEARMMETFNASAARDAMAKRIRESVLPPVFVVRSVSLRTADVRVEGRVALFQAAR